MIRFWNPAAERIFGYATADAICVLLDIIIRNGRAVRAARSWRPSRGSGGEKNGRAVSIEFTIVLPPRDWSRQLTGLTMIMRKVTKRFEEMRTLKHKLADKAKASG